LYSVSRNDDAANRGVRCGDVIQVVGATATAMKLGDSPVMRLLLPVGRSWIAIAAGYAGLCAILAFPAPIALALGIWALKDLKDHPEKHGKGRAIFGIVMGALGTVGLVAILLALMK
jgi:hypothetical protein